MVACTKGRYIMTKIQKLLPLLVILASLALAACAAPAPAPAPAEEPPAQEVEQEQDANGVDQEEEAEQPAQAELPQEEVRVGALMGPTGLGMLQLMNEHSYDFTLASSPDEIVPLIVQGNIDLASVPANLASVLYNNTDGQIQAVAINTLGVLHVVDTTGEINTIADLEGREVFLSGLGGVPEFAFNYVLSMNGLTPGEDVTLEFRAEHTEIAALLQEGVAEIALLPEPFATTVVAQNEAASFAIDLTQAWDDVQPSYSLVMGVLVGNRDFLQQNPIAVAQFLEQYEQSINFTNNSVQEAAELAVEFGIIPNPAVAAQAIPRSNIVFLAGPDLEPTLSGFLQVLYNEAPPSIGGSLPSTDFYFN